ncbi:hypothetical protein H6P81_000354 [Aristolochia fimbriata]|uniref:Uncharacterized protein n=1 Tax=Aristolochia fimbriata TaxID=158543 RepID=A0AAV7F6W6_ARIFI|nr:hypothetical protein H6P81_000354 [Aristolochia fimbriata]
MDIGRKSKSKSKSTIGAASKIVIKDDNRPIFRRSNRSVTTERRQGESDSGISDKHLRVVLVASSSSRAPPEI